MMLYQSRPLTSSVSTRGGRQLTFGTSECELRGGAPLSTSIEGEQDTVVVIATGFMGGMSVSTGHQWSS